MALREFGVTAFNGIDALFVEIPVNGVLLIRPIQVSVEKMEMLRVGQNFVLLLYQQALSTTYLAVHTIPLSTRKERP